MNVRDTLHFALGPIGSALLGFATLPAMAWIFSQESIGQLSMANITATFCLLFFGLGLDQAFVREYHEHSNVSELFKTTFLPGFLLVLVFLAGLLINSSLMAKTLFGSPEQATIYTLAFYVFIEYCNRYLRLILRMQNRGLIYSLSQLLPKLSMLGCLLMFYYRGESTHFLSLLQAHTFSHAMAALLCLSLTHQQIRSAFSSTWDSGSFKRYLRYSLPLVGAGVAYWGVTSTDRVLLRSLSDFEELGLYSVSVSLANPAMILQSVLTTVWAPSAYKMAAQKQEDRHYFEQAIRLTACAAFLLWSLAGCLAWVILYFLPQTYALATFALLCTVAQPLMYTLSEVSGIGLGIQKRTGYLLLASLVTLILNVCGNILVIPTFGALGAAATSALSALVFFLIKTESAARVWNPFPRQKIYAIASLLTICSMWPCLYKSPGAWIHFVFLLLFCSIVFFYRQEIRWCLEQFRQRKAH